MKGGKTSWRRRHLKKGLKEVRKEAMGMSREEEQPWQGEQQVQRP